MTESVDPIFRASGSWIPPSHRATANSERNRRYYRKVRARVLNHYGSDCVCCGETDEIFLTLDHIAGGGVAHRKRVAGGKLGSTVAMYLDIERSGYPDEYQILCFNCNFAKHTQGICPHQATKRIGLWPPPVRE